MSDLVPWLVVAVSALAGLLGLSFNRLKDAKRDNQEADKRVQALINKKEVTEHVQTLDDDYLVQQFDRLRDSKRG